MNKLDQSRAWNATTSRISANANVLAVVSGVFFFLPSLALSLLFPNMTAGLEAAGENQDAQYAAMMGILADYGWAFLLLTLLSIAGSLALLVLLSHRHTATVGEAIGSGFKLTLPYFGAAIIQGLIVALVILIPLAIAGVIGSAALTFLISVFAIMAFVYVYVRFSLTMPAMAIGGIVNPIKALRASWNATKGNTLRIFLFFLLLLVSIIVLSLLATVIFGLFFGLLGAEVAAIGLALVNSVLNALFTVVFIGAIAAVYNQLVADPATHEPAA